MRAFDAIVSDDVEIERDLGEEDDIGTRRNAGVQRKPAGVSTHDFHDHDAVVAGGGRVDAVEGFGCDRDGCLEAEGDIRTPQIVVNGFGDTDAVDASVGEGFGSGHGAVATDDDERLDAVQVEMCHTDIGEVFELDRAVGIFTDGVCLWVGFVGRTQDGATDTEDI